MPALAARNHFFFFFAPGAFADKALWLSDTDFGSCRACHNII
jgi:hypothetical protein